MTNIPSRSSNHLLFLQEFVNHGGVLFKVFIVGEAIKVLKRCSLPDIRKPEVSGNGGVFHFPRVSCVAASADDADLDPSIAEHMHISRSSALWECNMPVPLSVLGRSAAWLGFSTLLNGMLGSVSGAVASVPLSVIAASYCIFFGYVCKYYIIFVRS